MAKVYLTKEKCEELNQELTWLTGERRKAVAERLEFAKSLGDLSENAEYHAAREEQAEIEERISQLENLLKNCELIPSTHHGSKITLGSAVKVKRTEDNVEQEFLLVGPEEADPMKNKISYESPLGASLMDKKVGETVNVVTPRGKQEYQIVRIA